VFLGIGKDDGQKDMDWMIEKIINLRIFEKENGKFDQSLLDVQGELLLVSQFTLYGDCSKGRRPSFSDAMGVDRARELFEFFVAKARQKIVRVETGVFQAHMDVKLINDGPVTLIIDSK
jgi:D-tyrosyl-tRNA(Tyr) deacylase